MKRLDVGSRRLRGVSLVETVIVIAIFSTIGLATSYLLAATNGVSRRSHAELMAAKENRSALEHLSDVMRSASSGSLSGFDVNGVATAPQYQPVLGMSGGAVSLGPTSTLQWQAGGSFNGITNPGNIVMVTSGVTTTVVPRVAAGGFSVTQSGTALKIHIVTFHPVDGGGVSYATGDTTVAIRN